MQIGGLQKTTLIDYPEKIAAIIFTQGCNFRCFFCHNPELVLTEKFNPSISEKEIFAFLANRKHLLDGVVITGGEPTLQSDLLDFLKKVKETGYLVKLDTNGGFPEVIKKAIDKKLIDYIAMDIKAPLFKYKETVKVRVNADEIKKSIELIMESSLDYEFRSTLAPDFHTKDDVADMAKLVKGAKKYYLQKFIFQGKILNSDWKGKRTFTNQEMEEFRKAAAPFVKRCEVRG